MSFLIWHLASYYLVFTPYATRAPGTAVPKKSNPDESSICRGPARVGASPGASRYARRTIKRSTSQALSFTIPYRSIGDRPAPNWQVLGPGHFQQ